MRCQHIQSWQTVSVKLTCHSILGSSMWGQGSPLFTATLGERTFPVFHLDSRELFMGDQNVCIEGTNVTYFNSRKPKKGSHRFTLITVR